MKKLSVSSSLNTIIKNFSKISIALLLFTASSTGFVHAQKELHHFDKNILLEHNKKLDKQVAKSKAQLLKLNKKNLKIQRKIRGEREKIASIHREQRIVAPQMYRDRARSIRQQAIENVQQQKKQMMESRAYAIADIQQRREEMKMLREERLIERTQALKEIEKRRKDALEHRETAIQEMKERREAIMKAHSLKSIEG